jgi:hypothetical protein
MNDTNSIAATLIKQIGNGTFAMLGAGPIVALPNGIQFSIKGCKRGNKLVITLTPHDLYDVELWKVRGVKFNKIEDLTGVYVDSLHHVIETLTGLYTRL